MPLHLQRPLVSNRGIRGNWLPQILLIGLMGMIGQAAVRADGWHSPVLQSGSVDQWLGEAKAIFPKRPNELAVADFSEAGNSSLRAGRGIEDLKNRTSSNASKKKRTTTTSRTTPPRGGNLQSNLTPQQQAFLSQKANDALQVLAFMKDGNIYPREFPRFPIQQMGQFRGAAKQLLNVMGRPGSQAIAGQLRSHLMSGLRSGSDISYHPDYVEDMLEVLGNSAAAGWLAPEDLAGLREAMRGQKSDEVQQLADQLESALPKDLDFLSLLQWANQVPSTARKAELLNILRKRIPYAEAVDLEQAISHPEVDEKTKGAIAAHLKNSLPELGVTGLLTLLSFGNDDLKVAVERELRSRKPTYSEIQDEIPGLWTVAGGGDKRAAAYANWHVANAFQRAPMSHCLYWLGQDVDQLSELIWKQVDGRIARADTQRKAEYAEIALKAISLKNVDLPTKRASLHLLGRLKDRTVVKQLAELLLSMPRELWPTAGLALRDVTGASYGPQLGDGVAEVTVAVKQWREWAERNPR